MTSTIEHLDQLGDWKVSLPQRLLRRAFFSPARRQSAVLISEYWEPLDPWKGNATKGQHLASGSHPAERDGQDYHRLEWLRDMRDYGGSQARTLARRFALEWIDRNQKWSEQVWHPQLLSERIINMVLTWGWFAASASTSQQQTVAHSIANHRDVLEKDWKSLKSVNLRVRAVTALILSSAFLEEGPDPEKWGGELIRETLAAILADGCHATRQPDLHLDLLKSLIEAKIGITAMMGRQKEVAATAKEMFTTLEDCVVRMGNIARMWRHGNGDMMRLLGSGEVNPTRVDEILDRAGPKGRVTNHAGDGGFIRLASGRSILLMNTAPAPWALSRVISSGGRPEAGALSIEFSNGNNPIIINAGQRKELFNGASEIAEALAGTAAYSTLSVDHSNAADLTCRTTEGRLANALETVTGPAPGGVLAECRHDGYERKFGLIHQRRVFLATGGNDLRGEDTLLYDNAPGLVAQSAVIRFHLHPDIRAQMSIGGDVILRLPKNAAPWQFKAKGADINVEDSAVLDEDGLAKSTQITLTFALDDIRTAHSKVVKWALKRQTPSGKRR
jgi:uncharacterized heparinase superfamily protein